MSIFKEDGQVNKSSAMRIIQLNVICSFMLADDYGYSKSGAFMMESDYFDTDLRPIVTMINERTATEDRFYGELNVFIESKYPVQWMEFMIQTPLEFNLSLKYYDKLSEYKVKQALKNLE